jgi:RsiW-degrading membrane proteinase PrsW (M82 family)
MNLIVPILIALIVPVLFLFILRKFDLHKTAKFHINIGTLIWGLIAYLLAVQSNRFMQANAGLTWDQVKVFTAPVAEEILKAGILLYLVSRPRFNYIVDGALYGFGAGIGFAIIENVEYVGRVKIEAALALALARVFSTNLMHAAASGLIGTALAFHRGNKNKLRGAFVIAGGFALAILLHSLFNAMVGSRVLILIAVAYGVVGAALIWFAIRRGMAEQKDWVKEKLGMQDRVTKEETRAVASIETVIETLIAPFRERFGDAKVPLVRDLMTTQAEIGIKRKLIESTPSPTKKAEVNAIIETLQQEMERLRKQIGMYEMMFVRTVYLEQDWNAWSVLTARIAESGSGQKGGGLWDVTTARIRASKSKEENP